MKSQLRNASATLFLTVLVVISMTVASIANACPMCSEAVTQNGDKLTHGYYLSIVGLVSLPFLLIGGISAIVFRSWWTATHPGQPFHYLTALRGLRN